MLVIPGLSGFPLLLPRCALLRSWLARPSHATGMPAQRRRKLRYELHQTPAGPTLYTPFSRTEFPDHLWIGGWPCTPAAEAVDADAGIVAMGRHYCAPASPASNLFLDRINYIAYNNLPRRELTLARSASSGTEMKPYCSRGHHLLPGGKFGSADSTYKDTSHLSPDGMFGLSA